MAETYIDSFDSENKQISGDCPSVSLLSFRKNRKPPPIVIMGTADIRLGCSLVIRGIPIFSKDGKRWIGMPENVKWLDRAVHKDFTEKVLRAVEAAHPGSTDAG